MKLALRTSIFLAFILTATFIHAQTTIAGGSVSGIWTKANSPYRVTGNINIDSGTTLTIESGVKVEFSNKVGVYVRGLIKAKGATGDSIDFSVSPITNYHNLWETTSYGWRGFCFLGDLPDTDTTEFSFCKFSYINKTDTTGCKFKGFAVGFESDSTRFIAEGFGISVYSERIINIEDSRFSFGRGFGSAILLYRGGVNVNRCRFNYLNIEFSLLIPANRVSCITLNDLSAFPTPKKFYKSVVVNSEFSFCKGYVIAAQCKISPIFKNIDISYVRNEVSKNSIPNFDCISLSGTLDSIYIHDILDTIPFRQNSLIKVVYDQEMNKVKVKNIHFVEDTLFPTGNSVDIIRLYSLAKLKISNFHCENVFNENKRINSTGPQSSALSFIEKNSNPIELNNITIFNNNLGIKSNVGLTINNSIIANCTNEGIRTGYANLRATNLLIVNNGGYGIFSGTGQTGEPTNSYISNSIIVGNRGDNWPIGGQVSYEDQSQLTFKNCIIENGKAGFKFVNYKNYTNYKADTINCITGVPTFVNPTAGAGISFDASAADWHLKSDCNATSIGFNQGTDVLANKPSDFSTASFNLATTDIDGNPRVACGTVDIGPYEMQNFAQGVIASNLIDSTAACAGDTLAAFLSTTICTAPASTYQWQVQNNGTGNFTDISGATQSSLSLNNVQGTWNKNQYRLKIVNTVCNVTGYTDTSLLNIKPPPMVNLGSDTSIINNQSITLMSNGTFSQYKWDNNSSNSTRTVGNDTNLVGEKIYWLEVIGQNGCKGRDSIKVTFKKTSNVPQLNTVIMELFPNPNNGIFNLSIEAAGQVSIVNLTGQTVWSQYMDKGTWQLNNNDLNKGVYIIQWQGKNTSKALRLVIE